MSVVVRVRLLVTPLTAARQASLSFTISRSLPRLMSIESVMPLSCVRFAKDVVSSFTQKQMTQNRGLHDSL